MTDGNGRPGFLHEPPPPRGVALPVLPGVRRIVAPNPGPLTHHGTNSYLVDGTAGTLVVDPGPEDPGHRAAILAATGGRIAAIVLTHRHADHAAGARSLASVGGAPVLASAGAGLLADRELADGDAVAGWVALHTPGHAADHLCFARDDGVVFSGDQVMGWSTTVVSPPEGDMAAYMAALARLAARGDRLYLPGHGPPIADPAHFVAGLLRHRLEREAAIAAALDGAARALPDLAAGIYPGLDPLLSRAAERSLLAHLLKLEAEGRARRDGTFWRGVLPLPP